MRNKIMALVATLIVGLTGGAVAAASPAQAAFSDCPANYFCMWIGQNGTGARFQFSRASFTNATNNGIRLTSGISNRTNSWYNRLGSGWTVHVYDSTNCNVSPWYRHLSHNQQATGAGSDWGNRISSIQLWNASPLTC